MRNNGPITNVEYVMQDSETIVSKTDLSGNITYVNQDFINVSGFTREELMGAPQNIVRHPDMPKEAFADFWSTIKSGKAWTGLVKNRCKNGDHYWVEANVAPLLRDGQMVGYTSIRIKPSRDKVEAAEKAYAAIRNGDKSLKIVEGQAVQRSASRNINFMRRLRIKHMLTLAFALWMLCALMGLVNPSLSTASSMAGLILAPLAGVIIYRCIAKPVMQIKHDIEQMSAGDLTGRIIVHDDNELGGVLQELRVLQTNIKLLVGQIKEAADVVNSGAAEISSSNMDLSARTESQASSLEETASSMEELTSTIQQNAENSREANQLVVNAHDIAKHGSTVVTRVIDTMSQIKDSSNRIVDIISVIDGIAFQTNILALNAAVEAARAGEQGRGFAVVAAEVRNLAQRSASAAKEIKTLIDTSVEKVEQGSTMVTDAGETMDDILQAVDKVAGYIGEISAASAEQSAGVSQVNQAIIAIDDVTQRNAAVVEEAAAAAENMRHQATQLAELIDSFKLLTGSARGLSQPARPRPFVKMEAAPAPSRVTARKPELRLARQLA